MSTEQRQLATIGPHLLEQFLALVAGLFFSWRQIVAARESHLTERFSRAVEHLNSNRVEVRVGGVQGLDTIARERVSERLPIVRMLSVFIVERLSAWLDRKPGGPPLDVQVALAAVSRLRGLLSPDLGPLGPHVVHLHGADFSGCELADVDFSGFDLRGALFNKANLERSSFAFCNLADVSFEGANLNWAILQGSLFSNVNAASASFNCAVLRNVIGSIDCRNANLERADFEWGQLQRSDFRGANLRGTHFYGTVLVRCKLDGQDLRLTRGLYDILAGPVQPGMILPGKDPKQAYEESTKRPQNSWRPTPGMFECL